MKVSSAKHSCDVLYGQCEQIPNAHPLTNISMELSSYVYSLWYLRFSRDYKSIIYITTNLHLSQLSTMTVQNTQIAKSGPPTGRGGATGTFCPGPTLLGPQGTHIDRDTLIEQSTWCNNQKIFLKSLLYSISESLILKIFLGASPQPPFIYLYDSLIHMLKFVG